MKATNKRIAITSIMAGCSVLVLMFQNMTLVEFSLMNMPEIDEDSRQDQARELLGAFYNGSTAQKMEGEQYLNYLVYKKIESSMRPEWKPYIREITQALIRESQRQELDPIFVLAVIQTESQFNPWAKGSAGELGLMQILPRTAEWISKKYKIPWAGDNSLYDPVTNIKIGITYFAYLRTDFASQAYHYLPAYNMGPKNLRRVNRTLGTVDADGQLQKRDYAVRVMKNYSLIYQEIASEQRELTKFAQQSQDAPSISR
jgi:soluble lytic murein transglycosylase